jgi:hypothetical protein
MRVAIHQPNFLPWYPFFQKIKEVDIFVLLKECQFEKNNFQNRVSINGKWRTMSVNKGLEPIKNKTYLNPHTDWNKIKNGLSEYKFILNELDSCISDNLANTNFCIISSLCKMLDIDTKLEVDYPTNLKSTERLVDICKKYNATEYYSGSGAKQYLDESLFDNIKITYQGNLEKIHTLEVIKKL